MITKIQLKHLQNLKLKKYRQNYTEFVIEGDKLITEALLEKADVQFIAATKEWFRNNSKKLPKKIDCWEISEKELEKISSLKTPPSVIAVVNYFKNDLKQINFNAQWTIVLDNINDPGNLGTIIRTADWFGISNIVCSDDCVELYNPKVIQATMGSVFRVKVFYTDILRFIKNTSVKKYAATLNGKNIFKTAFNDEGILIIGNESHGIRKEIINMCDEEITIPKYGKAESLNAAVASSIILSHITNNKKQ